LTIEALATLLLSETKARIYARGLLIGAALGLPVSTWQPGDPTRSDYHFISEILEVTSGIAASLARSGFLDEAQDLWLEVKAEQDFGVVSIDATFASASCLLTNGGGGEFVLEAGDVTVSNSTTDKTFTNVTGGTLKRGVGQTLALDFVADEAGSESTSAAGEIDELVTQLRTVTVSNAAAAVGVDKETEAALRTRCRDKLGALSPNGPRDGYAFVGKSSDLTGSTEVTDVRVYDDSDTGDVLVYLRGASGAVSAAAVDAVTTAILSYATPLCITPTVATAVNVVAPITYQLWVYSADSRELAEIEAAVESALVALFLARPIGGDITPPALVGSVRKKLIEATIKGASPYSYDVLVTLPATDVALTNIQVAVLGTLIATVTKVADP